MSILPIITAPDPRLKLKAKAVAAVDDDIRRLMDDMLETMYLAPGIGLAAPQVGVAKRVLVLDVAQRARSQRHSRLPIPRSSGGRKSSRPTARAACRCPSTTPT